MTVTLGSNISALRTIRSLDRSSFVLSGTFERLASGKRINRASDDAAGLAVATSLNAKARILGQAYRNINDGVSLIDIADQAFASLADISTRIRELAEQAANGTYSSMQRNALDQEAQALAREYGRIIDITEFNGIKLLSAEQEITIETGTGNEVAPLALGVPAVEKLERAGVPGASTSPALSLNGVDQYVQVGNLDMNVLSVALWVKREQFVGGISDRLVMSSQAFGWGFHFEDDELTFTLSQVDNVRSTGYTITDTDWHHVAVTYDGSTVEFYIDGASAGSASYNVTFDNGGAGYSLGARDADEFLMGSLADVRVYDTALSAGDIAAIAAGNEVGTSPVAHWRLDEGAGTVVSDSSGNGNDGTIVNNGTWITTGPDALAEVSDGSVESIFSLSTRGDALLALDLMESTIVSINQSRGKLGAVQNRLSVELDNVSVSKTNIEAAFSRIADADVAHETSELTRSGILQQAASAVLAQANVQPRIALTLLGI